jgi:hypothetical protein
VSRDVCPSCGPPQNLVSEVAAVVHRVRFQNVCSDDCRSNDVEDSQIARDFLASLPVFPHPEGER